MKTLKKILILAIVTSLSLDLSFYLHLAGFIFLAFFFLGILTLDIISFFNENEDKIGWIQGIAIILGIVMAIVFCMDDATKINRLYFKENVVSLDTVSHASEFKPNKFIFAFDNSGAYLLNNQISKPQYKKYCYKIINNGGSLSKDDIFSKKWNYKNFLISKLCCDLLKIENNCENCFYIFKIGDSIKHIDFCKKELSCTSENIKNTLKNFYFSNTSDSIDQTTNFVDFYNTIDALTSDNNYSYTLCIYSDFVHDLGDKKRMRQDTLTIRRLQKNLSERKNVIQNIFYLPDVKKELRKNKIKEKMNYECWMLPKAESNIVFFDIDKADDNSDVVLDIPTQNLRLNYLEFFRSDYKSKYSAFLQFEDTTNNCIRGFYNNEKLYISDNNYKEGSPVKIKKIKLSWDEKPEHTPKLAITHSGKKHFFLCIFKDDYNKTWAVIVLSACWALGLIVASLDREKGDNNV